MHAEFVLVLLGASAASAIPLLSSLLSTTKLHQRSSQYSEQTIDLIRSSGLGQKSSSFLRTKHPHLHSGKANLTSASLGSEFLANVTFGSQTFQAIIDTGSSDTWLVQTGFTCVDLNNNETLSSEACLFGPTYTPDSDFIHIADENFNISYADGEYLNGILGTDCVTFAGITVESQEVALANLAAWEGDGVSSGLVGLAYNDLTNAYSGTDASADVIDSSAHPNATSNREIYSSLLNTIFFVENLTSPVFSLALSRDASDTSFGGILTIGGIADLTNPAINASEAYATVPIEILTHQFIDPNTPEYQFYTITIDGFAYANASEVIVDATRTQFIVDSGTTLIYTPTHDAAAINALFDPPAQSDASTGGIYLVDCDATVPKVGVGIGGHVFVLNPVDLALDLGVGGGSCVSAIQDGGTVGPYVLGDVFLKNVLAVFDVGNTQMKFAARQFYQS